MVQLVILPHELSPLEEKSDQYTRFPQVLKTWGGGGHRDGSLSQHMGGMGGFQSKGKYLVNICTVACKLKNVTFLLN